MLRGLPYGYLDGLPRYYKSFPYDRVTGLYRLHEAVSANEGPELVYSAKKEVPPDFPDFSFTMFSLTKMPISLRFPI